MCKNNPKILLIIYLLPTFFLLGMSSDKKVNQISVSPQKLDGMIIYDFQQLETFKNKYTDGNEIAVKVVSQIIKYADRALKNKPYSVVDKEFTPPSGDKHDYMSLSIYWWPNPITRIPYIHKDGQRNPEADKYDGKKIMQMANDVRVLALAWYYTGDIKYAQKAGQFVRVWFLDDATRMNPNMNYAQGVPGLYSGGRQGIIETVPLATRVLDSVLLIKNSPAWSQNDHKNLQKWFADYADWLQTSKLGKKEQVRKNNHGNWYDLQLACFAAFAENDELIKKVFTESVPARISSQIQPDGKMPQELRRTKSFDYSCYNLKALFYLAQLGTKYGYDIYDYTGTDGQSISKALDYLLNFRTQPENWQYEQIKKTSFKNQLDKFIYWAYIVFDKKKYADIIESDKKLRSAAKVGLPIELYAYFKI